jgi:hypothetical protein
MAHELDGLTGREESRGEEYNSLTRTTAYGNTVRIVTTTLVSLKRPRLHDSTAGCCASSEVLQLSDCDSFRQVGSEPFESIFSGEQGIVLASDPALEP